MTEKSAVKTRKLIGSASTAMIGLSAFFIAAPVLGFLEPVTGFSSGVAAFAACTGLDAVKSRI